MTVIIPAWNEADAIGRVLAEVPRDVVGRIIVVDGGSTDGTADIAARHGAEVVPQRQRGYGAACAEGARAAGSGILVFLDGDYSDPPVDVSRLVRPIARGEADLVLGCRTGLSLRQTLPFHARLGNRLVTMLILLTMGYHVRDLPSYKALRADTLSSLQMREMSYGWTTEMIVKAARAGLVVKQIDITYRPRAGGRSKVSGTVRGSIKAGIALVTTVVRHSRWRSA